MPNGVQGMLVKVAVLPLLIAFAVAAPAQAASDHYLFAFSPSYLQTLTLNESLTIGAPMQTGWFGNNGLHVANNSNYLAALAPGFGYPETRNFFTFDVGNGVTNASVSIGNDLTLGFGSSNGAPITYTLYDVSAAIDTSLDYSGVPGVSIFDDLGTGAVYGWTTVYGPTAAVVVNFNAAGIAAINAAGDGGNPFTFGGRITVDSNYVPPVGPVPEPASWAMMIAGFGLVGAAMRRRSAGLAA